MKSTFFILMLSGITQLSAQNIVINKVEVAGDKVNLYYELTDNETARTYTISLFSSVDNYVSPLEKVIGDAGLEIKPGANKKITWSSREELGVTYEGEVALEIRGRVYIPFVRLDGLQKDFKRGKDHEITWTGGTQQNILNFDLYKGDHKVTSFPNIANVGHYTLAMPLSIKPGKGYRFKISDSKNKDQIVYSPEFAIKPKISTLLKIGSVVAVGGIAYMLLPGKPLNKGIPDPASIDDFSEN